MTCGSCGGTIERGGCGTKRCRYARVAAPASKQKAKGKRPAPKEAGERTPVLRQRFVEGPAKSEGRPFVAFRVCGDVRSAFAKHAKAAKTTPAAILRAYMSKVTGVADSDGEGAADNEAEGE